MEYFKVVANHPYGYLVILDVAHIIISRHTSCGEAFTAADELNEDFAATIDFLFN